MSSGATNNNPLHISKALMPAVMIRATELFGLRGRMLVQTSGRLLTRRLNKLWDPRIHSKYVQSCLTQVGIVEVCGGLQYLTGIRPTTTPKKTKPTATPRHNYVNSRGRQLLIISELSVTKQSSATHSGHIDTSLVVGSTHLA